MQKRRVGEFEVSAIGLGCMSLSHAYGPPPPREQAEQVLLGALDAGYTFFDTAAVYGLGHNETLVGEVLGPHRDKIVLCSKAGLSRGTQRELNGHPDVLKETCELSLKLLKTEVIDLYYLLRWDRRVPIEDSVGALADLVKAGPAVDDLLVNSDFRTRMVQNQMDAHAYALTLQRSAAAERSDRGPSAAVSIMKLAASKLHTDTAELIVEAMGTQGLGWEGESFSAEEIAAGRQYLRIKSSTIAGGSTEVQNNIISKRVLGLPDPTSK